VAGRGCIRITYVQAMGLRESIRPLTFPHGSPIEAGDLIALHEKILLVLVEFETKGEGVDADLVLTREDVLHINQFLSMQDGDWAADVLKQARRALYELRTGVLPGWAGASDKLWEGVAEVLDEDAKPGHTGKE
jgi:hypothetical protein